MSGVLDIQPVVTLSCFHPHRGTSFQHNPSQEKLQFLLSPVQRCLRPAPDIRSCVRNDGGMHPGLWGVLEPSLNNPRCLYSA